VTVDEDKDPQLQQIVREHVSRIPAHLRNDENLVVAAFVHLGLMFPLSFV
jgi:hypothetical protein